MLFFVFLIIVVFLIAMVTSYDKTEEVNENILKRFSDSSTYLIAGLKDWMVFFEKKEQDNLFFVVVTYIVIKILKKRYM